MRISNLTATVFVFGVTAMSSVLMSTTAYAACGTNVCRSNGAATTSGSASYGSYNGGSYSGTTYGSSTANCPAGTRPSSDGSCLITGSGDAFFGTSRAASVSKSSYAYASASQSNTTRARVSSYSRSAPLASYAGQSGWSSRNAIATTSRQQTRRAYGAGSVSQSYSNGGNTIVPFSTTTANISNYRVNGMGANEFLTPTTCPVSVYNPTGAKVLGCYAVSKRAPVRVRTQRVRTIRVVRPIIYVRYPVPVPIPYPVYQNGYGYANGCSVSATRYGANWPGRPCG